MNRSSRRSRSGIPRRPGRGRRPLLHRTRRLLAAVGAGALLAPLGVIAPAGAEPTSYVPLPQNEMSIVEADSVEGEQVPANVLDGNAATIWHTAWSEGKDPLPHHLSVQVAEEPVEVARVRLQPRQDSSGSGRIGDYEIHASSDPDCTDDAYRKVADGGFDGALAEATTERTITLDSPVEASCLKVVWLSSWGGRASDPETSPPEEVASLAELNVDVVGEPADPDPIVVDPPEGTVEITDGDLRVRLHPDFPQVVDYTLGSASLAGRYGPAHTTVTIDDVVQDVEVSAPQLSDDGDSATYRITVPALPGVALDAVLSVEDGVFTWRLTNIVDPDGDVHRIAVPRLDLASANGSEAGAQVVAADLSVDRAVSGDQFYDLASQQPGTAVSDPAHVALLTGAELAAGFETNAVEDNTAGGETAARVQNDNSRYIATLAQGDGAVYGTVSPGTFVVRGSTADQGLGPDEDPFAKVRLAADANGDGTLDWQDAAMAARDVADPINGTERVSTDVVKRIPFNIVSQATHPFLRTLDDTKRIALATDGLGQSVMLKGYQAEGHDSAHPDYAGRYNERAGGKKDFDTLVTEGERWNATFGVHVNATESYSEARAFSEDLLRAPIEPGWGWMNQSYMIDGPKDLGSEAILERFQDFRDESPENLTFLYMDVYYPSGWEGQRLSQELEDQGWDVSTEWANKMPRSSTWSHWATDENYGGSTNKGLNSQVIRFLDNSRKDVWNPDPLLSNANVQEFEGWTGHQDAGEFFETVWERNLPTKFLQRAEIVSWTAATDEEPGRILLADGTEVTSDVTAVSGTEIPTDRTITADGATVYEDGAYLLPWGADEEGADGDGAGTNGAEAVGGGERLYHWNPEGGTSTWTLTDRWSDQSELIMHRLSDDGRVDEVRVPVEDGQVTLETEAGSAYVLHPVGELPEPVDPQWGLGTAVADPGFFSGTLDQWRVTGEASVETDEFRNRQAVLEGGADASISQHLHDPARPSRHLPAGTWSAWAWVEIEPGQTREVTVSASGGGVTPVEHQAAAGRGVATTIDASTAVNATASDTKHGRHFQRVRVTFESTGAPVALSISAGAGEAPVRVDDVRVVPFTPSADPAPTEETVLFTDFETVDTGYWPFVTGADNIGGDARTQLQERHEPYSQAGWYGVDQDGEAVEGGKLTDNVLRGQWSLMANEENDGLILRTTQASMPLTPGHRYRLTVDHQTAFADTYRFVIGEDVVGGADGEVTTEIVDTQALPQARETEQAVLELTVSEDADVTWIGVEKLGGGRQANLTLDDLRVEDLGPVG
ncbi:endo-alpha-N-acetylgalactosaminidase family protein [Brachybacterium sp. AOP43-C2-M15]|uniref:endo-alpha-N-acetylgalactosaminidase family protein n=1 Tax=Brachybacterium sp. AOP43-C2-M15 TaxID=3457661 RepID=UPI004033C28D